MDYFEGLSSQEIYDLVQNEAAYEMRLAEMNPTAYIAGLEYSTFLIKTEKLTYDDIDFKEYYKQRNELQFSRRFSETEDITYDYQAYLLGEIAAVSKPLELFVINGLREAGKN